MRIVVDFTGFYHGCAQKVVQQGGFHFPRHFEKPDWLGSEVTGDKRYYNAMLKQHPYSQWKDKN